MVMWREGGEILLIHSYHRADVGLECPKCRSPMLFIPEQVVCYACGATYDVHGQRVVQTLGVHSWPDAECGKTLPYDPTKTRTYYEELSPSDVQSSQE